MIRRREGVRRTEVEPWTAAVLRQLGDDGVMDEEVRTYRLRSNTPEKSSSASDASANTVRALLFLDHRHMEQPAEENREQDQIRWRRRKCSQLLDRSRRREENRYANRYAERQGSFE